ncbi:MAG TPA: hypothetical protein DCM32_08205, partial [Xanthomonadaceae bacterium]|nr:hypothetical protein [Xanthomonadaceae bacterium]
MHEDAVIQPIRSFIVVLGMHRSGTSAMTGALCAMGFSLGGPALPAAEDNPLGYFENAAAVDINEALLLALGRGWDDLRPLPDDWERSDAAGEARRRIGAWLDGLDAPDGRLVLKDPRLCLVFPLWREVLVSRGIEVRVILAHRALPEIVASLVKRDALAERHALLLTLAHVLQAEYSSRGLVRVACRYGELLENLAQGLRQWVSGLGLEPVTDEAIARALASFDPGQRHHRHEGLPLACAGVEDLCDALARTGAACEAVVEFDDTELERVLRACRAEAATLQPRADALCLARGAARTFANEARTLDAALGATRALALLRLADTERLGDRLRETDRALADATRLASLRLAELGVMTADLASARVALSQAEALAFERLDAMAALDAALLEAREALAHTGSLAMERGQRADALAAERDALAAERDALV